MVIVSSQYVELEALVLPAQLPRMSSAKVCNETSLFISLFYG